MKKIVIVTGGLGSGGLERVVAHIANHYSNTGWDVSIVCLLDNKNNVFVKLEKNVKTIFFSKEDEEEPRNIKKVFLIKKWITFLKKQIEELKPTIVFTMTLKIASLVSLACGKRRSFRLVMREISDPKSKVRSPFVDFFLFRICKSIDSIIFQTEWEKRCYPSFLQEKGVVVFNPIKVYDTSDGIFENKIVTMGRLLNNQKRHDVLIKAFSMFSKNNKDYTLKIYGEGPDFEKDIHLIKKLNIENRVVFCGAQKNVHTLIKNSSMFIMTSDYEGLSNALVEAMLIGVPCISSDWPGASELIENGRNGFIYKRQNVKQLVGFMNALANDKNLAKTFSENGKKESWKYDLDTILPLYCKAIEGDKNE